MNTSKSSLHFNRNVIIKALVLFLLLNLIFALVWPIPPLGRISAYNSIFPGRLRLPYGDDPKKAYNLSLYNLEAMFASHELTNGIKPPDEYRILLIGDSSTWGFLLPPQESLSSQINSAGLMLPDGRHIRAYNLGYPVMSLTKDLVILSYGMRYQPDMVVWLFTLESFPKDKQLFPPLLGQNSKIVRELIKTYNLNLDQNDPNLVNHQIFDKMIIGQRRALADLIRLQLYGVMWAATGIDQYIPETYTARMNDLSPEEDFHNFLPPQLSESNLAIDVLHAGIEMTGDVPILLVNEPMFISNGKNSDIRYNFYYPRWAYDNYRKIILSQCQAHNWHCLDLWDSISPSEFTNSAVHLSTQGSVQLAQYIGEAILQFASSSN
jgi:hypothetical protein